MTSIDTTNYNQILIYFEGDTKKSKRKFPFRPKQVVWLVDYHNFVIKKVEIVKFLYHEGTDLLYEIKGYEFTQQPSCNLKKTKKEAITMLRDKLRNSIHYIIEDLERIQNNLNKFYNIER